MKAFVPGNDVNLFPATIRNEITAYQFKLVSFAPTESCLNALSCFSKSFPATIISSKYISVTSISLKCCRFRNLCLNPTLIISLLEGPLLWVSLDLGGFTSTRLLTQSVGSFISYKFIDFSSLLGCQGTFLGGLNSTRCYSWHENVPHWFKLNTILYLLTIISLAWYAVAVIHLIMTAWVSLLDSVQQWLLRDPHIFYYARSMYEVSHSFHWQWQLLKNLNHKFEILHHTTLTCRGQMS